MRIIGEIPHPECKITLFSWNNRYLIKLEQAQLEQTFKVNQFDVTGEGDLYKIVNDQFLKDALSRFEAMQNSLNNTLENL
jgi:predicted secreted protein